MYRVIKNSNNDTIHIVSASNIETTELCECYTSDGQKYSSAHEEGYGENEWEEVITYHDGRNWQSIIIDGSEWEFADEELEAEILAEYEAANWKKEAGGYVEGNGEKYKFTKSRWATDNFEVARVEENE